MQDAAGGQRLPVRQPGRDDRHEPAVPDQARQRRSDVPRGVNADPTHRDRIDANDASRDLPPHASPAAPASRWPCPGWNRCPSGATTAAADDGRGRASPSGSPRCSWATASTPTHWWAKGAGAEMELGKSLEPLAPLKTKLNVINGLFNKAATGVGIHPGPDRATSSPARRCRKGPSCKGGISIDQVLANAHRPGDGAAEPGPRLRAADHRLPRDELLDGLQLAHLLAERDLAGADGGLSVAGVRQPVRQPRQPAEPEHPRPRPRAGRQPQPAGQRGRPGQARRVPDERPRGREAGRPHAGRSRPSADDNADDQRPAARHDAAARQRPARRHPRAHAADVRHRRPGVSDRQDARRHAAALPRSLGPVLSVPRRPHGPPLRVARRPVRRLRADHALLRQPARLPRRRGSTRCPKATARCSTTRA